MATEPQDPAAQELPAAGPPALQEVDLGSLQLDEPVVEEGPARRVERTRALLAYPLQ